MTERQRVPALAEHGPTGILGVRLATGYIAWSDFQAQAVAGICRRIGMHQSEQIIGQERRNRDRVKEHATCPHDGCLLTHPTEPCPACITPNPGDDDA